MSKTTLCIIPHIKKGNKDNWALHGWPFHLDFTFQARLCASSVLEICKSYAYSWSMYTKQYIHNIWDRYVTCKIYKEI